MKYKYTKISREFVILFASLSLIVVCINIAGLTTVPHITPANLFIILFLFFNSLLSGMYLIFGYKKFDYIGHKKIIRKFAKISPSKVPTVDIFLPSAGEELKTLVRTFTGVSKIKYPLNRMSVYVLDDKGCPEVKKLAEKFNFVYLSRQNKGEFKKAGNLKFGYGLSKGEYILILDADFRPKSDILVETIPYMAEDSSIGIVVTPQDFIINKKEPKFVQSGDAAIQEYFYRICQPGRSTFNAAICTGTNAVYRRKALADAGGFYQIEHSEDSHTGLNLRKHGHSMLYLPVVLATGYCPSDYKQIYKQRSRWCQGSLTMAKSKLFWSTNHTFMSLVCYFSGFTYYLSSFIFLLIPFNTLYILSLPQSNNVVRMLFFLPNILFMLVAYTTFYYTKFSFSVLGNQLFFYWTYAYTIISRFILNKNEPWTPTGTVQKKNRSYNILITIILSTTFIYWALLIKIISRGNIQMNLAEAVLWFWIGFNLLSQVSMLIGLSIGVFGKSNIAKIATLFSPKSMHQAIKIGNL